MNIEANRINQEIVKEVESIYRWIEQQIENTPGRCLQCGRCCDFESFGHRLFITSPEMIYFVEKIGPDNIRKMTGSLCPYNINNVCTAHECRFAACRIFFCDGDLSSDRQNELSEYAIEKFKELCRRYNIPYSYRQICNALNNPDPDW